MVLKWAVLRDFEMEATTADLKADQMVDWMDDQMAVLLVDEKVVY